MPGPTKMTARTRRKPKPEPKLKSPVAAKAAAAKSRKATYGPRVGKEPPTPKPRGPRPTGSTSKTKTVKGNSPTKKSVKKAMMVGAGKPYKGTSSKKAVSKTTKKVTARSGKTGKAATKQARRIVRSRKAKNSK